MENLFIFRHQFRSTIILYDNSKTSSPELAQVPPCVAVVLILDPLNAQLERT
jgi:hypothetical protein